MVLLLLDLLLQSFGAPSFLVGLFALATEKNIPTLYSTAIIAFSAILLWACYKQNDTDQPKLIKKNFMVLSYIFTLLAIDEWISIHDVIGGSIGNAITPTLSAKFGAWTTVYFILSVALLLFFSKFLFRLPKKTAVLFFTAGSIYVLGAIGFEYLADEGITYSLAALSALNLDAKVFLISIIEESLEITGILLFNYTLIQYLNQKYQITELKLNRNWVIGLSVFCIIDTVISQLVFFMNR